MNKKRERTYYEGLTEDQIYQYEILENFIEYYTLDQNERAVLLSNALAFVKGNSFFGCSQSQLNNNLHCPITQRHREDTLPHQGKRILTQAEKILQSLDFINKQGE